MKTARKTRRLIKSVVFGNNVILVEDSDYVKIYVNNFLHIHFLRKHYRGFTSFYENYYTVEILLLDQKIVTTYDDRSMWEAVLMKLDEAL